MLWHQSENLMYDKLAWYSTRELRTGSCILVRLTELWNAWCPEHSWARRFFFFFFFLQTDSWIFYITKSNLRSADTYFLSMVLVSINLVPRASFLIQACLSVCLSICRTSYLRNHTSCDHNFWYTCVKWWCLQVFCSFL